MDQILQSPIPPHLIDLGVGNPGPDLLPLDLLREAASHALAQGDTAPLQYGYEQGDIRFRQALAAFLEGQYHLKTDPGQLFVSNGVSQALDLICTLHTQPGDVVFVEEPTYFLALRIFADHRLQVVGLPTDEHGLVVEALEEALRHGRPALLYTVPTHQNPSGATLPAERRRRLAELAQAHGFLVVADEVYHCLTFGGDAPPPPMAGLVDTGAVLSLGSFSKILAPGLRLGWIQGRADRLRTLAQSGLLDSGGGLNPFTAAIVRSALALGLQDRHLARLRRVYAARLDALDTALQQRLGDRLRYRRPGGGFFVWARLADGRDAEGLMPKALAHGVSFRPGVRFSSRSGLRDAMRLCFAYYDEEGLREGVDRLARALGEG
ncbi:MAG: PLP-dependent aminotransferase family protein [Caldilineales bacterium]|nr:PLP-dependent aminotransferase family protein [Caldilineales bacterium]MDW8318423.1 PLP-dependent aminotransferase family protein [Anaerolineae bacterium]